MPETQEASVLTLEAAPDLLNAFEELAEEDQLLKVHHSIN